PWSPQPWRRWRPPPRPPRPGLLSSCRQVVRSLCTSLRRAAQGEALVRVSGIPGHLVAEPVRGFEGPARLLGVELDLTYNHPPERSFEHVDLERQLVMWHLIPALRHAPALGQRPQGGELLLAQIHLFLAPDLARASLHGQHRLAVLAAQPHLRLSLDDRQVALLDLDRQVLVEPRRPFAKHELALDLEPG